VQNSPSEQRKKPQPLPMRVHSSERLSANMQRLVLVSDQSRFSADNISGYIKLLFHKNGQPVTAGQEVNTTEQLMRTYTIRAVDPALNGIVVDFALHGGDEPGSHGHNGPASGWAATAKPGDDIMVGGPGPAKWLQPAFDWVLLAADMTGLPALACNLEQLAADAVGYAVVDVMSEADIQPLTKPAQVELIWVVDDQPPAVEQAEALAATSPLLTMVQSLAWLPGEPSVWAACEFHKMRALRHYIRQRGARRSHTYISSYWKTGRSEDQHKLDKKADAETAG